MDSIGAPRQSCAHERSVRPECIFFYPPKHSDTYFNCCILDVETGLDQEMTSRLNKYFSVSLITHNLLYSQQTAVKVLQKVKLGRQIMKA